MILEQISLFDMKIPDIDEVAVTTKPMVKEEEVINVKGISYRCSSVINKYSSAATRIIQLSSNRFAIELENKILYLDSKGVEDYSTNVDLSILAIDQVVYADYNYITNELQDKVLAKYIAENRENIEKVIKRYGDNNYIIVTYNNLILGINNKGWILEYTTMPSYDECEVIDINNTELYVDKIESELISIEDSINLDNELILIDGIVEEVNNLDTTVIESVVSKEKYEIGQSVFIMYGGQEYIGTVMSIYNNCDTFNIIFDGKHSAFHRSCVKKVA